MVTKKSEAVERFEALEQVLIDVWHEAQGCDGSRGEQQKALDEIQNIIEVEMPDVAGYEPSDSEGDATESETSDEA